MFFIEQADSIGIGQHQAGSIFADSGFELFQIYATVLLRRNADNGKARHCCAGRVGAMSGIGNDDFCALQVPRCLW